jgi:hypothetical protein
LYIVEENRIEEVYQSVEENRVRKSIFFEEIYGFVKDNRFEKKCSEKGDFSANWIEFWNITIEIHTFIIHNRQHHL